VLLSYSDGQTLETQCCSEIRLSTCKAPAIHELNRLVMEHHWQSDRSGRGRRTAVIMGHRYGSSPLTCYDDDVLDL